MAQQKFIYFDIGGVLLEYKDALKELARDNGVTVSDFDRIYDVYGHHAERGEMTLHDLWGKYKSELHLKEEGDFDFLNYWTDRLLPISENHDLVTELAASHRVGILSNIYKDVFPVLIEKGKIPDAPYSIIVESCEVKHIKPEKQIYKIAQNLSTVQPTDIIYIDDRKDFVDFAGTLGWNGIWYEKGSGINLRTALAEIL